MKELRGNKKPFGGAVTVLTGDLRQTLPIVTDGSSASIIGSCLISSEIFNMHFKVLKLHKNMRAEMEKEDFKQWLLDIG